MFIYYLLFGALISPTDPVAVIGILKTAKILKSIETKITEESFFDDGTGVVAFLLILEPATDKVIFHRLLLKKNNDIIMRH